jgi:hypothetical protein
MDPNTKTMVITGGAAESYMNKGSKTRRRGRSTAQSGGTSPGTIDQLQSSKAPTTVNAPPVKPSEPMNLKATMTAVTTSTPALVSAPVGGSQVQKPVKVILGPKAKSKSNVILTPVKGKVISSSLPKTRKSAKKIRMSLQGFGKRVTRANKIRFDAKKQGIDDIKKILKEAKLVKETTNAPETLLRKIYSDYMMLKSRAL